MADFKPSQVILLAIPLVGTMGKAEIEFAAACLVRACVVLGDSWQPVPVATVAKIFEEDYRAHIEPMRTWGNQPFVRPSPALMAERAFAVWGESAEGNTLAFTEKGIAAMQRWVRVGAQGG